MHISLSAGEMAKKSQILRKSQTRTTILEGRIIVITQALLLFISITKRSLPTRESLVCEWNTFRSHEQP